MRRFFLLVLTLGMVSGTALAAGPADLIEAVQTGNAAAAIKLIDQKVNVNGTSSDGTTALHWAAHKGDVELVDRLIRAGATVNVKNEFGATPISEAASAGNTAVLEKLLKAGANPNTPGPDGMTPLMVIARSTNVAAARLLLDNGADTQCEGAAEESDRPDVGCRSEPGRDGPGACETWRRCQCARHGQQHVHGQL
jgi:ankyrin repeat protein